MSCGIRTCQFDKQGNLVGGLKALKKNIPLTDGGLIVLLGSLC